MYLLLKNMDSGFILINKKQGPTSFNAIYQLRKITGVKKIGHAGTLDPFADGLLIVAIGREATKEINKYVKLDKEYVATLKLGEVSNTYDIEGEIVKSEKKNNDLRIEDIKKVIKKFIGKQKQIPPMFSAKKVGGKKLYELARKGIEVERKSSLINIFKIEVIEFEWPVLKIKVNCSSGTYIRSLGHDIGQVLGCGAYLKDLKRTKIGEFELKNAVFIDGLNENNWRNYLFI